MNEKIADILTQPAFDRLKDWHDIGPVQKATLELFAELIVKECADISDASFHNGSAGYTAILKHFGVEA